MDDIAIIKLTPNGTSASRTRYGKYYVTMNLIRITDKSIVAKFQSENGLDKAPASHTFKKFGFRIESKEDSVILYRNSHFSISEGKKAWAYNVKDSTGKAGSLYNLSFEVEEADKAFAIDFTIQSQIDAAMAIYKDDMEQAAVRLRSELRRIYSQGANQIRYPTVKEEKPDTPKAVKPPSKKRKTLKPKKG